MDRIKETKKCTKCKTKCDICNKKYQDGDTLNIAFVKNYKNIVICDKCVVFLKEKSTDTEFIEMNQVKSE